MKTIKFFHPEETLTYYIDKCFCKVVFSNRHHQLLIEIHSTDDLDHVEGDALQNDFPQVVLTIDDFPINFKTVDELNGNTVEIPHSFAEIEDEEGYVYEVYYSNVNFNEELYESDDNKLRFFKNGSNDLCLKWTGKVSNFISESDDMIPFEIDCVFTDELIEERY